MERLDFRVMGSDATVVVVGGPAGLAEAARDRLDDLEALWSRFRPDSEISRLNAAGGAPLAVSPETVQLVETAVRAWHLSDGACDPTVLGDVLRSGYTTSFERLAVQVTLPGSELRLGAGGIRVAAGTVRLPAGVGFDPGGIGKGLAADMVVGELLAAGAEGACVNVGGDLKVAGHGPGDEDEGWVIGVDAIPDQPGPLLGLARGGVATSSRRKRRWTNPGGTSAHHLIDPRTGTPADTGLATVTVVAAEAWQAEMLAKSVFLAGPEAGAVVLDRMGAAGLLVTDEDAVLTTFALDQFLLPDPGPAPLFDPHPDPNCVEVRL
ncbi:MAG TPA: FAD:protein FMN transferase [Actinomycetota bacterium]|nr:FAD:protein FMN transferase [Actinomycetota bacterium]